MAEKSYSHHITHTYTATHRYTDTHTLDIEGRNESNKSCYLPCLPSIIWVFCLISFSWSDSSQAVDKQSGFYSHGYLKSCFIWFGMQELILKVSKSLKVSNNPTIGYEGTFLKKKFFILFYFFLIGEEDAFYENQVRL